MYTDIIEKSLDYKLIGYDNALVLDGKSAIKLSCSEYFKKKNKLKKIKTIIDVSDIAGDVDFASKVKKLLSSKISAVTGLESWEKKDTIHYKSSGLSKALCDLARKNNVAVLFSLKEISRARGTERARLIGRIKQNIELCRKYRVKTGLVSFAETLNEMSAPKDVQALAEVLGMNNKEAKNAVSIRI